MDISTEFFGKPKQLKHKKVLLRERKRHTDRRVTSPAERGGGVDRQTDGQSCVKTLLSPILRMRLAKIFF